MTLFSGFQAAAATVLLILRTAIRAILLAPPLPTAVSFRSFAARRTLFAWFTLRFGLRLGALFRLLRTISLAAITALALARAVRLIRRRLFRPGNGARRKRRLAVRTFLNPGDFIASDRIDGGGFGFGFGRFRAAVTAFIAVNSARFFGLLRQRFELL